jgi:glycosyltransferase involved in cell wall biosynthesis
MPESEKIGPRPRDRGIIFVDRTRSTTSGYRAITWLLADRMPAERWTVLTTSAKSGRVPFLTDMLATLWRLRSSYAVASVAVFSGPAFMWAEAAASLLRALGKPYVLQLHGGGLPDFARREPNRVRGLLTAAAAVSAPSHYLQETMRQFRGDIRLLPNAIDLHSYALRVRTNPAPHLVWLRAFHAIYNPSLALKVLAELARERPESRLTMVGPDKGDGSLQAFKREAVELKLDARVEYVGLVPKTDVPTWLNRGDIFLNTTSIDNTPVSVIEAMACGLCVVSTNVGGIPYLLEHDGDALLVPPDDPKSMAAAVKRILTEPGLAEKLSLNARRKVDAFDWKVVLPQWEALFTEVIERA